MKLSELIQKEHTIASKWLFEHDVRYIMDNLGDYIVELGKSLDSNKYVRRGENIWISTSAEVSRSAVMEGPLIIDEGAIVRQHAYIRGKVIIGKRAVIGHCSEVKNAILCDEVKLAHFNYVGDSVIGYRVHFAAGAVLANQKLTKEEIVLEDNGCGRMKKLGAIVGDNVEIGCHAVVYPGAMIGKNSIIYPLVGIRGEIVKNSIVKSEKERAVRLLGGRVFGTDGIRGVVQDDLTMEFVQWVAHAMVNGLSILGKTIVIGQDTRESSDWIRYGLISVLLSYGIKVIDAKVLPTPAISYLTKKYRADFGVVITASHNPVQYNGIKIFNELGEKIDRELEEKIEKWMSQNHTIRKGVLKCGMVMNEFCCQRDYIDFLKGSIDGSLEGLKIVVDCANGATSQIITGILRGFKAEVIVLNNQPDGKNINKDCGVLDLQSIVQCVTDNHCDCGIVYDGDGDRCIMVDSSGKIVDGDDILAILAKYLKQEGKLLNQTIVSTVMCNLGLEEFCERFGIRLIKTDVGDRNVMEAMKRNGAILGSEPSGHVVVLNYLHSGDGELASLKILEIMKKENKSLCELAAVLKKYPRHEMTIPVNDEKKEIFKNSVTLQNRIEMFKNGLSEKEKLVVRLSGTEPIIRILIEGLEIEKLIAKVSGLVLEIEKEWTTANK